MTAEQQNAGKIRGSSGDLTYADLRDSFGLDDSFYEARREIWAIVQQNISDMAHSMRQGVVALHGAQSALTPAEAAAASPPESEMAKSVGIWLGETSNAEWLEQCRSLIVRHVGVGTPTLGLSALKTAGNIAIAEMLRRHCTDIDHYHRLSRAMYTLAAIQDVIIANVHQTYLRSMATARLREQSARFRDEIAGTIGDASRRSAGLRDAVNGFARSTRIIVDGTSEIVKTSDNISVAMTEASQNASHLLTAIEEASNNVTVTASVADQAFQNAEAAVTSTATLSDHAGSIDSILSLIRSIAGQTNLLALNATIEAARAGDAGRGFAVVAQEVKSLAAQTAQATGEIAKQIEAIQASAGAAIGAMTTIRDGIVAVHKSTTEIRGAMEKNALTATMISDSIHDTARSVALTSKTVQDIMSTTTSAAGQMETVDVSFAEMADQMHALDRKVQIFVGNISMEG